MKKLKKLTGPDATSPTGQPQGATRAPSGKRGATPRANPTGPRASKRSAARRPKQKVGWIA